MSGHKRAEKEVTGSNDEDIPEVLTTLEAAKVLRCDPKTLRSWIAAGKVHASRVGRRWLIPRSEVERILKS